MNRYAGKICPFCKTAFAPDDEVVVCSACEMPHHKDCWVENQGCTTFGCNGTIQSAAPTAPEPDNVYGSPERNSFASQAAAHPTPAYCPYCGAPSVPTDQYCKYCGRQFPAEPRVYQNTGACGGGTAVPPVYANIGAYGAGAAAPPAYQNTYAPGGMPPPHAFQNQMDEDRYLVVRIAYYKNKFAMMRATNQKTSWNWPAFLFTPYWCIYRKMYAIGIGLLAAVLVSTLFAPVGVLIAFAGRLVFGIYANYLYMRHIQQLIETERGLQEPFKTDHVLRSGGVNTGGMIFFVVLDIVISAAMQAG